MKKEILSIIAISMIMFSCKNNLTKPFNSVENEKIISENTELFNKRLADNRYKALNDNNIKVSRIIFQGYPAEVQAEFWKFKLENWRNNIYTPDIEKKAIDELMPKITKELFTASESDGVYINFINYIENEWLKKFQPYINYERLMFLIASPYYPENPNVNIVINGSSGQTGGGGISEECGCNISRTNDFCNGVPGSGTSGGVGKTCKITNNCYQTAHGCGWLWVMTCKGECK